MKVLVHARGVVGRAMGSTGVRCYHTARVLAEELPEAQITLAIPNEPDMPAPHPRVRVIHQRNPWMGLIQMLSHDIIISRNFSPSLIPLFFHKRLALDFYTAFFVEWMALSANRIDTPSRRAIWAASNRHYIDFQLTLADFVFCANERQRDAWVGAMSALGLITPQMYDRDSRLRRLIDVVPYGVQPGRPKHTRQVLKGVVPNIRETDTVLLWNGSIMEWFDALTVIRAIGEVSRVRDDVKLYFLGTEHPDLVTGLLFRPPQEAVELSKQLGLYERSVFFNFGWVPYNEIGNFLAEADIGVCASFDNLEARYSFRTRFVDLFWAELPMICTEGDVLAERVRQDPLGIAVAPGDVRGYAEAILRLVKDKDFYQRCRGNMPAVKEELSWERVLTPLVEFCRSTQGMAAPKRQRLPPLIRRAARYGLTHSWQQVVTRER